MLWKALKQASGQDRIMETRFILPPEIMKTIWQRHGTQFAQEKWNHIHAHSGTWMFRLALWVIAKKWNTHWKDWCWSWSSNNLATWCKELIHWKRPWCWEQKGTTEDEMIGWHHRLHRLEFEQTLVDSEGQGSLACCSLWGCTVGHLTTEQQ